MCDCRLNIIDETMKSGIRKDFPTPHHNDVVGGTSHLWEQMGGHYDTATFGGKTAKQFARPNDAIHIQAIKWFV